ncbi:MAG TPA: hypothetical protein VNE17_04615 [Nitrolancea sp.]|nr:hypothetical protein [Nitrolancea sp.]
MSSIRLDAILMIVLFVATSGFAMSQLFERLDRSYLFTILGSRTRLLTARIGIWGVAIVASLAIWSILVVALPGFAALAIFFAFEAIVLDICTQRIQYERRSDVALSPASSTPCRTMTRAI